jgi:hypothetical protein
MRFLRWRLGQREERRKEGCYIMTSSGTVVLGRDETLTSITVIRLEHRSFVAAKLLPLLERTIGADGLERSDDGSVDAGNVHKTILRSAR